MQLKLRRPSAVILGCLVVAYGLVLASLFLHRHLEVPDGSYDGVVAGQYEVVTSTSLQVPAVFHGKSLQIARIDQGRAVIKDDRGQSLFLVEGSDGYYFTENFRPAGAWILPGIARNWNEGRIFQSGDAVVVDGVMLEMGLTLFVFPFKDLLRWEIKLTRTQEPPERAEVCSVDGYRTTTPAWRRDRALA